jgi:diguanylate cyclase (GGDEF)-like protein
MERGVNIDSGQSVRVILVGRTGLDGALRLDPDIELVRVRTPLEAVAELAGCWDEQGSPRSVVIVAPDAVQSLGTPQRLTEFVGGLRSAEPRVVVLASTKDGGVTGFDGAVSPDLPSDDIRKVVRGHPVNGAAAGLNGSAPAQPSRPAAPAIQVPRLVPQATAPPPAQPSSLPGPGEITTGGDLELVQQLIRGKDILPSAITMLRERLGDDGAEFLPVAGGITPEGHPVSLDGQVLGAIRTVCNDEALVALQARWLGAWLRLRDQQNQLKAAAFTDPLTGAYNRRYFERFLASALEQARAARRNVTVMVFDIDDFKTYNDRYGHDAGDEILRETVKLMRSTIRPTDRVCRIGGDEFAVIFYEPEGPRQEGSRHPQSVFDIAQRFQQHVQQHKFPKMAGLAQGALTVSGGLATFPWDGMTVDDLVKSADDRALKSKRQGKNAITLGLIPEP